MEQRELTEEEAARDITLERFNDYHVDAGEDWWDDYQTLVPSNTFIGYLLGRFPERNIEILKVGNDKYATASDIFGELHIKEVSDEFYTILADFINLTVNTKKKVNEVLINTYEYYNKE